MILSQGVFCRESHEIIYPRFFPGQLQAEAAAKLTFAPHLFYHYLGVKNRIKARRPGEISLSMQNYPSTL